MKIFRNKADLRGHLDHIKRKSKKIGFIPTMGGIHQGHISLIAESLNRNLHSVSSVFVNPSQFNNDKDFLSYPKNEDKDTKLLGKNNCSVTYLPNVRDIYPKGLKVVPKVKEFRDILCDKYRPGHFDGVTTVVERLFDIVQPDYVFFGEKDYQQLKIIKSLVHLLKLPVQVVACPSIRNSNGMSLSTRYKNFNKEQKILFSSLSKIIKKNIIKIKKNINNFNEITLKKDIGEININNIDYIEIRNEKNLLISKKNKNSRLFIALYIDSIRVVDNFKIY